MYSRCGSFGPWSGRSYEPRSGASRTHPTPSDVVTTGTLPEIYYKEKIILSSIFLSHTSLDKPFVEKLARDLKRIGINVWFDKWEIKIGESITWRIEEGIRENEYLGIVLSPEALGSEWVKSELGAAWVKQMQLRKVFVIPIYYRDCDIPLFIR